MKLNLRVVLFSVFFSVLGVVGAVYLVRVIAVLSLFAEMSSPSNDEINADPKNRPEMIRVTLDWGRLAPFPETASGFEIHTEGNPFTRTFRGSFSDTPENVRSWLNSSPGVTEGKEEKPGLYILSTGEGAGYGEIRISEDGGTVSFRVSWS